MKSISTLLTAALLLSVGNGLAVPPKYTYANFPESATCATQTYDAGEVEDAGDAAGRLKSRGKTVGSDKHPHQYPHQYFNHDNEIRNFDAKCKGPFYEFPILQDKKVYVGNPDDPGADRVVVNVSAMDKKTGKVVVTFCGLMTHTGARNMSAFTQCTWK